MKTKAYLKQLEKELNCKIHHLEAYSKLTSIFTNELRTSQMVFWHYLLAAYQLKHGSAQDALGTFQLMRSISISEDVVLKPRFYKKFILCFDALIDLTKSEELKELYQTRKQKLLIEARRNFPLPPYLDSSTR